MPRPRILAAVAAVLMLAVPAAAGAFAFPRAVAARAQDSALVASHRSAAAVVASHRSVAVVASHRSVAVVACAHAATAAGASNLAAMRSAVLCLVNRQRTAHGLPALSEDSRLDRSAQGWTQTMVANREFTHGANFAARISAAGFAWSAAGENIATGFATPSAVVKAWMASLGHCRNILNPSFSAIGIGVVDRAVTGYASGPATWTQDFGLPIGRRAPSTNTAPANHCPY